MSRLIDADKLCEDLLDRWSIADTRKEELIRRVMADIVTPIIASQPSAEPPLIRCKDCRWWTKHDTTLQGKCGLHNLNPMPDWYCASGEVGVDIKDGFTKRVKSVADSYRS